ncbi:MAG: diphthine synthase [Candidatus Woesearchaeota archaeon]|nr:MAG: diphthine synthase [Candidatus Woesearchaeota archaeon]
MTLHFISLGLSDEKDISLKGLETIKKCDKVYLENYTSLLNCSKEDLEKVYGKAVILAERELVESKADTILNEAAKKEVAFLVIGNAFTATTHTDLMLRARERGIEINFIHNASILNAVGVTGLSLYKFGKITSIPFDYDNIETPYDIIKDNRKIEAHTLVLLDLDPSKNKYLKISEAIRYLLKVELKRGEKVFTENTLCIGCSRIGNSQQVIKAGNAKDLLNLDFKKPPYCLIIPSKLHFMEEEALGRYK